MLPLPVYIPGLFIIITFLTVFLFCRAMPNARLTIIIVLTWLAVQALLALNGFYTVTNGIPPRFIFLLLPPVVFILILFAVPGGRRYIKRLDIKALTLLHTIRIPVELGIYWLYIHKAVPQLMTFEGRNFDIFSGLTAPLVYYFGFIKKSLDRKLILLWNFICLGLLINIVVNAILSAPLPFQWFAFDQPNIAVLYFPFIWLACCIVPLVFFAHLAAVRQLLNGSKGALNVDR